MDANKLLLLLLLLSFYKNTYNAHSLPCAYRTQCTGSKVWCPPETEKKIWAGATDTCVCSIKNENKMKIMCFR